MNNLHQLNIYRTNDYSGVRIFSNQGQGCEGEEWAAQRRSFGLNGVFPHKDKKPY